MQTQRPNITRGKKTNNPDQIKNWPRPEKENRSDNVLVLATELTDKIKKVEEMMKALQNKESECYPCVSRQSLAAQFFGTVADTEKQGDPKNINTPVITIPDHDSELLVTNKQMKEKQNRTTTFQSSKDQHA